MERVVFILFVVFTDTLFALNTGWVFLVTFSKAIIDEIVPIFGAVTMASYLAFILVEEHLTK